MGKFGFNIEASQTMIDPAWLPKAGAAYHLIMTAPPWGINRSNEINNLNRYRQHLPDSALIWPTWPPKEGDWILYPAPIDQLNLWKAEGAEFRNIIRDDPCNEPSMPYQRLDLMQRYVQNRTELLNRAADAGYRVAVGAFSVGTPHESLLENGIFDPLLQAIHAGNHLISYHSYATGIPGAGDLFPFDTLRDPQKAAAALREYDQPWKTGRYWFLRRTDFFQVRAAQIGLPTLPTVMTEAIFDDVLSVYSFYQELRQRYGMPEYSYDLRGVTSWRKYWSAAFPGMHLYEILDLLLDYMRRNVYHLESIHGVCLFALNKGWETRGHNWGHPDLIEYLLNYLPELNRQEVQAPDEGVGYNEPVGTIDQEKVMSTPISHAFVLPDTDFYDWLTVLQPYLKKFERVAVVRSPAGNDLNPYRNVTAVTASKLWMNDDPIQHIRRIYPQVVRVDAIRAKTPQELAIVLQSRITANDRFGEKNNSDNHLHDRFVLEWPTDYLPMKVVRPFTTQPTGTSADSMGVDVLSVAGAKVLAAAPGKVSRQWVGDQPDALNLGKYVQITSTYGATTYTVTYAGLGNVSVPLNTIVNIGDEIGKASGDSIRIIVQASGGASGYRLPNIVDPMPMLYVTNLRVRPTTNGLRIRSIPDTTGTILGQVNSWDMIIPKEQHGRVLAKVGVEGQWIRIRMPDGRDGYAAAWFLQGTIFKRLFAGVNPVGVNLDQLHPLGTPDPARLGRWDGYVSATMSATIPDQKISSLRITAMRHSQNAMSKLDTK